MQNDILEQLITLSTNLGKPPNDYVILGKGNTSAKVNDDLFWVKASGTQLATIDHTGFVKVCFDRVLPLLDNNELSDEAVIEHLKAAKVDSTQTLLPITPTIRRNRVLKPTLLTKPTPITNTIL